jgi:Coenzyme PQQ synthesis protein D (PqqD)
VHPPQRSGEHDAIRPVRRSDVQWRTVGGEVLILQAVLKQYHVLNEVAARIWELADGRHTQGEIADVVSEEYSHDRDAVYEDVVETIRGLEALQLIEVTTAEGSIAEA